jgi:hypothetical protein
MKGKSLEDINQLFEDHVPIKEFGRSSPSKREEIAGDKTLGF